MNSQLKNFKLSNLEWIYTGYLVLVPCSWFLVCQCLNSVDRFLPMFNNIYIHILERYLIPRIVSHQPEGLIPFGLLVFVFRR